MADSKSFVGASPVASIAASCVSRQLLLIIVIKPAGPCNSNTGSESGLGTPATLGPNPRTIIWCGTVSDMVNAFTATASPVPTAILDCKDRNSLKPLGVGETVGFGVGVGVGPQVPPKIEKLSI